ncbi:hypothetical protein Btru_005802, partial [Bulinus truncatus]
MTIHTGSLSRLYWVHSYLAWLASCCGATVVIVSVHVAASTVMIPGASPDQVTDSNKKQLNVFSFYLYRKTSKRIIRVKPATPEVSEPIYEEIEEPDPPGAGFLFGFWKERHPNDDFKFQPDRTRLPTPGDMEDHNPHTFDPVEEPAPSVTPDPEKVKKRTCLVILVSALQGIITSSVGVVIASSCKDILKDKGPIQGPESKGEDPGICEEKQNDDCSSCVHSWCTDTTCDIMVGVQQEMIKYTLFTIVSN